MNAQEMWMGNVKHTDASMQVDGNPNEATILMGGHVVENGEVIGFTVRMDRESAQEFAMQILDAARCSKSTN